jgi:glucose-6-phosphate 1-epimerase
VNDINQVEIEDYAGCTYSDKVTGKDAVQANAIRFDSEIDRVYHSTPHNSVIRHSAGVIHVTSQHADSVVWNPWKAKSDALADMEANGYLRYVCLESGNIITRIDLEPNSSSSYQTTYSVEDS